MEERAVLKKVLGHRVVIVMEFLKMAIVWFIYSLSQKLFSLSLFLSAFFFFSLFMIWHEILASSSILAFALTSPFHLTSKLRKLSLCPAAWHVWPPRIPPVVSVLSPSSEVLLLWCSGLESAFGPQLMLWFSLPMIPFSRFSLLKM